MDGFELTEIFAVAPARLYAAWLDGATHAAMTGAEATGEGVVGGAFTAWDGYISGRTLALEHGRRIEQAWRTTQFPAGAPDSHLTITFEAAGEGTRLTLRHTGLPPDQRDDYRHGWRTYYFEPIAAWLAGAPG